MIVTNYTTDDMKKLPLRAIVAFGARCRASRRASGATRRTATRRRSAGRGDRRCPPGRRGLRPRPALPDGRLRGRGDRGVPGIRPGRPAAGERLRGHRPDGSRGRHGAARPGDTRGAGGEAACQRWTAAGSLAAAPGGSLGRPGRAGCLHGGRRRRRCRGLCRRLHGRGRRGLQEAAGAPSSGGIPRPGSRSTLLRKGRSGRSDRRHPPGPESRHEEHSTAPRGGIS